MSHVNPALSTAAFRLPDRHRIPPPLQAQSLAAMLRREPEDLCTHLPQFTGRTPSAFLKQTSALANMPHGVYDSFMRRGTAQALRVLNEAFVPDERKAEVRKRLARLKGQVEGVDRMLTQN